METDRSEIEDAGERKCPFEVRIAVMIWMVLGILVTLGANVLALLESEAGFMFAALFFSAVTVVPLIFLAVNVRRGTFQPLRIIAVGSIVFAILFLLISADFGTRLFPRFNLLHFIGCVLTGIFGGGLLVAGVCADWGSGAYHEWRISRSAKINQPTHDDED